MIRFGSATISFCPREVESFYPYSADGVATFNAEQPYYDAIAALNFLAGCTHRVRLGTHVLILPYRNPVVTAKMLATLDVLSAGRLILGAGVGWMEEEFQALGLDTFAQRGAVTNEYIRLFKELWTAEQPEFHGEFYNVSRRGVPAQAGAEAPPAGLGGRPIPARPSAGRRNWGTDGCLLGCVPRRFWSRKSWRKRSRG